MEVAGVVLGGIPLIITALENYRKCAAIFDDYANHEAHLNRKKHYLWLQKWQLEATLRSVGFESSYKDSADGHTLQAIAAHLRSTYSHDPSQSERFVAIIQHMDQISRDAASILNGGSPEQMWNSSLRHCFESVELPSAESVHGKNLATLHGPLESATIDRAVEETTISDLHKSGRSAPMVSLNSLHAGHQAAVSEYMLPIEPLSLRSTHTTDYQSPDARIEEANRDQDQSLSAKLENPIHAEYELLKRQDRIVGHNAPSSVRREYRSDGSVSETTELFEASQPDNALTLITSTLPTSQSGSTNQPKNSSEEETELDSRDLETVYSLDSAADEEPYVTAFAHRLLYDLKNTEDFQDSQDFSALPSAFLSQTLRVFARRLYEEATDPFQWATSTVLHRKHEDIRSVLTLRSTQEADADCERRLPFPKSTDAIALWLDETSTNLTVAEADELLQRSGSDEDQESVESSSSCGDPLPQLTEYEKFIQNSDAYQWLLNRIRQHEDIPNKDRDAMGMIGDQILSHLRSQRHLDKLSRSRPQALACMTFHLQWDPQAHIISLGLDLTTYSLDMILCLTGTERETQAMSITDYLRQTWPANAELGVVVLRQLVALPKEQEITCRPIPSRMSCRISIARDRWSAFTISIIAGANLVSDFAQQLAWLAATLRPSPHTRGLVTCYPRIRSLTTGTPPHDMPAVMSTGICRLSFSFEDLVVENDIDNGLCWASMFVNPILATGFPIRRGRDAIPGMEMSLSTMASLALTDQVVKIGDRIIMKSFNVLLVALHTTASVAVWHCFVSEKPEDRISYYHSRLQSLEIDCSATPSLRSLESVRHIVGWCSSATDFCGHASASLDILPSGLKPSPASIVIDRMYIEAGMHVIGGASFLFNKKEQPVKLHRTRHYPELLSMVAAHPVAFFDVTERRVWLVDGASALLHLTRISLHIDATDPESPYDWTFDEMQLEDKWTGCCGRVAAIETLKSWKHRALPIFVKEQCTESGQTTQRFATFEDRVNQILQWLEVIIDRDRYLASENGIKIRQTLDQHRCTTGYDILDLLKPLGPVGTRSAPPNRSGQGWADLFPVIGVTTIFGGGFGELIRPNDTTQTCSEWRSLPGGLDFMAVNTSTLKMIYDKRLRRNNPDLKQGQLTPELLWKSSCHPLTICGCVANNESSKEQHIDFVQSLSSKNPWRFWNDTETSPVDIPGLDLKGAVVFSNGDYTNHDRRKTNDRAVEVSAHSIPSRSSSDRLRQSYSVSTSATNTTHTGHSTNHLAPASSSATALSATSEDSPFTVSTPLMSITDAARGPVPPTTISVTTPTATAAMTESAADATGGEGVSSSPQAVESGTHRYRQNFSEVTKGKSRHKGLRVREWFGRRSKDVKPSDHGGAKL